MQRSNGSPRRSLGGRGITLAYGASAIGSLHNSLARLAAVGSPTSRSDQASGRGLAELHGFGSNPGSLRAGYFVPEPLPPGAPLVVVLHGCTQTATGYDHGSGWSRLAAELGFAVLLPEQQRANNPNLCFNWFSPRDSARDAGEALSIRQMVAAMQALHGTDPQRVFVTGLSAGGAMAAVMLATYPEVFAGGAVIAGLPFGIARSVPEALERMRGQGIAHQRRLAELVRNASDHSGPWPTLSVWHGSADQTVSLNNAQALVDQWRILHGAPEAPDRVEMVDGHQRRRWLSADGQPLIEDYLIGGMGHGTPLSTSADGGGEVAGAHMLEAGISSTRRIAGFWGIGDPAARRSVRPRQAGGQVKAAPRAAAANAGAKPAPAGIRKTIEDALRAAGLIR